jgi:hypothetical protein
MSDNEFFGNGDDDHSAGIDMMSFIMDLPLLSLLHFQEEALPQPAGSSIVE